MLFVINFQWYFVSDYISSLDTIKIDFKRMKSPLFLLLSFMLISLNTYAQKSVKVALAQIFCLDSDKSGNLTRIENAIIESKNEGAEIILFPEMALVGWVNPDAHLLSKPIPGEDSDYLSKLAKKYGVYICIGLGEKEGDKLFDSAILISDTGEILLKHRKNNILTELMEPSYSKGVGVQAVETKFGKVGVMICADSFKENLLTEMADLKPDLLLIPYGWAAKVEDWPEHGKELHDVVEKVSLKVKCPVIGTDLVGQISQGPWKGLTYGGQSVAYSKNSKRLHVSKDRDRDITILDIKL